MGHELETRKMPSTLTEPGLGMRIPRQARRMVSGHEQLETFADLVREAVADGSLQNARLSFMRLGDALDAHLTLEDQHFFPALRGLKPELAHDLTQLICEHAEFRIALDELRALLAKGSAEAFALDFETFCGQLADHEAREERLIRGAVSA
jgi:hypothetical protein